MTHSQQLIFTEVCLVSVCFRVNRFYLADSDVCPFWFLFRKREILHKRRRICRCDSPPPIWIYSSIYSISQSDLSDIYCKCNCMLRVWASQRPSCGPHFLRTVSYHLHANLKPLDLFYHIFETSTLFQMIRFLSKLVPSKTVQNKQINQNQPAKQQQNPTNQSSKNTNKKT